MMDLPAMAAWLSERHTSDLFRLETLPSYTAASDGGDYQRWRDGLESTVDKSGWLQKLRDDTAEHRRWRRVRVLHTPLTDYQRYSIEWGYPDNVAAGEDVRVLVVTEESRLDQLVGDFFVVDGQHVLRTHYDDHGVHQGGEVVTGREAASLIAIRDLVWSQAVPFTQWAENYRPRQKAAA